MANVKMNKYRFKIILQGEMVSPSKQMVEAWLRSNLHLSIVLHDTMDDFVMEVEMDEFDRLREMEGK